MALFYVGPRPVLRGRNSKNNVHPWKGTEEKYSNYSIFNTEHVLQGAPNRHHVPGTGRHPHGLKMSRLFMGLEDAEQPLVDPGLGPRLEGARFRPLENKAAGNNLVFKFNYGWDGIRIYSHNKYDDSNRQTILSGEFGHAVRYVDDPGTANSFGRFGPYAHGSRQVGPEALEDPGDELPEGYDYPYGYNKINEWRGVPAAKAIKI